MKPAPRGDTGHIPPFAGSFFCRVRARSTMLTPIRPFAATLRGPMSKRHLLPAAALMLAFVAAAGCDSREFDAGPKRTETRNVGSFDSIDLDGSARLLVTVGESKSVSVAAPASVIEHVTTEVEGDTLHIRTRAKDWVWVNGGPRIEIAVSVPQLKGLRVQGGNDVRMQGFKGGASSIAVQGAAHVRATGELDALTVSMQGAGFADLSGLTADAATVTVDGIGKVIVHSKNKLDATMNGIGSILYTGAPHDVSTRMNGFGSIEQRSAEEERKQRRHEEHEWKKHRHHDMQDRDDEDRSEDREDQAKPEAAPNPDDLQPEIDTRPGTHQDTPKNGQPKKAVDMTKVI